MPGPPSYRRPFTVSSCHAQSPRFTRGLWPCPRDGSEKREREGPNASLHWEVPPVFRNVSTHRNEAIAEWRLQVETSLAGGDGFVRSDEVASVCGSATVSRRRRSWSLAVLTVLQRVSGGAGGPGAEVRSTRGPRMPGDSVGGGGGVVCFAGLVESSRRGPIFFSLMQAGVVRGVSRLGNLSPRISPAVVEAARSDRLEVCVNPRKDCGFRISDGCDGVQFGSVRGPCRSCAG